MQLAGQARDLTSQAIVTQDVLIHYSRQVAGFVERMLVPLLARDAATAVVSDYLAACSDLGVAMQITDILRDVGEDLTELGRIYLPLEMMAAHQLSPADLSALVQPPHNSQLKSRFVALWEELAQ